MQFVLCNIFVIFNYPKVQLFIRLYCWMLIHLQIALFEIKFMEILVNVYWQCCFYCWREWIYNLRKWTAKDVFHWHLGFSKHHLGKAFWVKCMSSCEMRFLLWNCRTVSDLRRFNVTFLLVIFATVFF